MQRYCSVPLLRAAARIWQLAGSGGELKSCLPGCMDRRSPAVASAWAATVTHLVVSPHMDRSLCFFPKFFCHNCIGVRDEWRKRGDRERKMALTPHPEKKYQRSWGPAVPSRLNSFSEPFCLPWHLAVSSLITLIFDRHPQYGALLRSWA